VLTARAAGRHAAAFGLFALLAVAWSFPLAQHLSTHIPGAGPGDNLTFLWNLSWTRQALSTPGLPLLHTTAILHPFGANLTLHTHTVLHGLAGALVPSAGIVATLNVLVLVSLCLNGFVTYLLAFDLTRRHGASIVAGTIFGGSPYVMAHLPGHFNLVAAYVLPLFVLAFRRALARPAAWRAALAGLTLAWCVYSDYYYGVYAVVFAAVWIALRHGGVACVGGAKATPLRRRHAVALAALGAGALMLGLAVAATGGWELAVAGFTVSMRETFNLRAAAWLFSVAAAVVYWRPTIRTEAATTGNQRRADLMAATIIACTALALTAPLWLDALRLWRAGAYSSQTYWWRSAPRGIDAASPMLGNPLGPLTGGAVTRLYERLGLDLTEGSAWLGVVPALLLWSAWRQRRAIEDWRLWRGAGLMFLLWSLGPYLCVMGANTGAVLPAILLRYVPVVNNARMPGRAVVIVYLAVAMLAARAIATWPGRRQKRVAWLCAAAVAADYLAAPLPIYGVTPSSVDSYLAAAPAGAVCELPVGVRDGFGEIGRFDHRALYHQTVHRHPIVGGFVARLPASLKTDYLALPIVGPLIEASAGQVISSKRRASDAQQACRELQRLGIRYVVVNADTAPAEVVDYLRAVVPLTLIAQDGSRTLYAACR
jgi:hypothetical protein